MLIIHRMAQLGVVNQKRPEVWQSNLISRLNKENIASVSLDIGNHTLTTKARDIYANENMGVSLSIGDNRLIDPTKMYDTEESIDVTLAIGKHTLYDVAKVVNENDDLASVSMSIGGHKLYAWGVSAESTTDTKLGFSLTVGEHKLYEEQ